jgi:hypothetical protein
MHIARSSKMEYDFATNDRAKCHVGPEPGDQATMRQLATATALTLLLAAPTLAATLETSAQVTILPTSTALLTDQAPDGTATWSVTGERDAPIQVTLEWRTADGRRLAAAEPTTLTLDAAARSLATPATPTGIAADQPVATLVLCRE